MNEILCKLSEKIELSNQHQLRFSEFGTRRRFSIDVQETVIKKLNETAQYCTGTSNCNFAMKYGMKMMGTHPHEWFMFHGAQFGYKHANYMALENWVNVYDGDLGIALSDTYTSGIFLSNLSRKQAKLFDGVRCDSGNEFEFIDKLVARYKELGNRRDNQNHRIQQCPRLYKSIGYSRILQKTKSAALSGSVPISPTIPGSNLRTS